MDNVLEREAVTDARRSFSALFIKFVHWVCYTLSGFYEGTIPPPQSYCDATWDQANDHFTFNTRNCKIFIFKIHFRVAKKHHRKSSLTMNVICSNWGGSFIQVCVQSQVKMPFILQHKALRDKNLGYTLKIKKKLQTIQILHFSLIRRKSP